MRKMGCIGAALALLACFGTPAAAEETTLSGRYVWEGGGADGELEAVLTPSGDGEWEIAFHFTFRGKAHTYEGTARGSLSEGSFSGSVQNENKRRTFTFSGEFEDGVFSGTHAELHGEKESPTGTLTLR